MLMLFVWLLLLLVSLCCYIAVVGVVVVGIRRGGCVVDGVVAVAAVAGG